MRFLDMDRFDEWLETELHRAGARFDTGTVPTPRYASLDAEGSGNRAVRALLKVTKSKIALAAGVAMGLAASGVAAKALTTGDPNPLNWGSTVTQQVQMCKDNVAADQHGIGQCVSSTANQHGSQVSGSVPPGPPSPFPGNGLHNGSGHPGGSDAHPSHPPQPAGQGNSNAGGNPTHGSSNHPAPEAPSAHH
ncbi:MAG: hypothetical protein ABR498_05785 [Candidatus Dormibacteria bacterium]